MSVWPVLGDIAHVVSLVNVLGFAYAVGFHKELFDPQWKEQGFCIMNPDVEYWTSHDLCLYADVALAAVQAILVALLRREPGMEVASSMIGTSQLLGVIGHGIGHGAIARALRNGEQDENVDYNQSPWEAGALDSPSDFAMQNAPLVVFWIFLLRSALPGTSWPSLAVLAVVSILLQQLFPANFGFTYVQSVLFIAFGWNELMMKPKEEKGFEYALYPWLVGVPLGLVAWLESTQCSKFVIGLGGHLIYDAYIPLAMMSFYMICWLRASFVIKPTTHSGAAAKTKLS